MLLVPPSQLPICLALTVRLLALVKDLQRIRNEIVRLDLLRDLSLQFIAGLSRLGDGVGGGKRDEQGYQVFMVFTPFLRSGEER